MNARTRAKRKHKSLRDVRRRHEAASAICGIFHAIREWAAAWEGCIEGAARGMMGFYDGDGDPETKAGGAGTEPDAPECSICRRRHGREIEHACE